MSAATPSPLVWQADADGQLHPYSPQFADIYRSSGQDGLGGLAQARHSFLMACGLLAGDIAARPVWQHQAQWHIAETGFGLGLNFLATWQAWLADAARPQHLIYSAIEVYPVSADDLRRSALPFSELHPLAEQLACVWAQSPLGPGLHRWQWPHPSAESVVSIELRLYIGDVQSQLPQLAAPLNSIFLDGFKPQNNAAMWSLACMEQLAAKAAAGCRIGTWTAAGMVRRHLELAGFQVQKRKGMPPKRESLAASWGVLNSSCAGSVPARGAGQAF